MFLNVCLYFDVKSLFLKCLKFLVQGEDFRENFFIPQWNDKYDMIAPTSYNVWKQGRRI